MLQLYAGHYQFDTGLDVYFSVIDGNFMMEIPFFSYTDRMVPIDEHTFVNLDSKNFWVFILNEDGKAIGIDSEGDYLQRIDD